MLKPDAERELMALPAILGIQDICSLLRISPDTVYREIRDGRLLAYRANEQGNAWSVARPDLIAYLADRGTY